MQRLKNITHSFQSFVLVREWLTNKYHDRKALIHSSPRWHWGADCRLGVQDRAPAGAVMSESEVLESRVRLVGGLKRYFHGKRVEGLLSSAVCSCMSPRLFSMLTWAESRCEPMFAASEVPLKNRKVYPPSHSHSKLCWITLRAR